MEYWQDELQRTVVSDRVSCRNYEEAGASLADELVGRAKCCCDGPFALLGSACDSCKSRASLLMLCAHGATKREHHCGTISTPAGGRWPIPFVGSFDHRHGIRKGPAEVIQPVRNEACEKARAATIEWVEMSCQSERYQC